MKPVSLSLPFSSFVGCVHIILAVIIVTVFAVLLKKGLACQFTKSYLKDAWCSIGAKITSTVSNFTIGSVQRKQERTGKT